MILHDLHCPACNETLVDFGLQTQWLDGALSHWPCGTSLQIVSGSRHHHAAVHSTERCVVFINADGKVNYPGRNDLPTPPGYERRELNSFREVEQFTREHGNRNEIEGFDQRGTGRGFEYDGTPDAPANWKDAIRWQD